MTEGEFKYHSTVFWIFIFFFSLYSLTAGGHYYSADGLTIFLVARSLISHGTFFISDGEILDQLAVVFGVGHKAVPIAQPLHSLLMLPLYLLGSALSNLYSSNIANFIVILTTSFLNVLVSAALMGFFYLFATELGYDRKTSVISTLIFGLTTIIWPYSKFDFSEPVMSLFIFGAFYWIFLFRKNKKPIYALFAGLFLGASGITKVSSAITIIPLIFYFLFVIYERRKKSEKQPVILPVLYFAGSSFLFLLFLVFFNFIRFGDFTKTGYGAVFYDTPIFSGLFGLIFSTGKGFFTFSPTALLFFFGIRKFYSRHKVETLVILTSLTFALLFYAKLYVWHGDVALGPRYLVYLTPFVMLPIVQVFSNFEFNKNKLFAAITIFLIISGFFIQLVNISVFYNHYLNGLIAENPDKLTGYDKRRDTIDLSAIYFRPTFSPVFGGMVTVPKKFINWVNSINSVDYAGAPSDIGSLFDWYFKDVPDYWWVYYSMAGVSRKPLLILIVPLAGVFFSGIQLKRRIIE